MQECESKFILMICEVFNTLFIRLVYAVLNFLAHFLHGLSFVLTVVKLVLSHCHPEAEGGKIAVSQEALSYLDFGAIMEPRYHF